MSERRKPALRRGWSTGACAAAAARAGIVKDAGDDPDVTHGAMVVATVARAQPGAGIRFRAGVGTVTLPGLPLAVGEPDVEVTLAIPGGATMAARTMNARLGIVGGLSILGTTGIVVPYSCSAWIASIERGIDRGGRLLAHAGP